MNYGLAATTYGNVLNAKYEGSIRAVYTTKTQIVTENGSWFTDDDGNGSFTSGDTAGVWVLQSNGEQTIFRNGDGQEYYFVHNQDIPLSENKSTNLGAALYVDGKNGDKLFGVKNNDNTGNYSSGDDVLIMYEIFPASNSDEALFELKQQANFYQTDKEDPTNEGKRRYFKIARKIVELPGVVNSGSEETGNKSDYLEEALWWKNQKQDNVGFTAAEFDTIKSNTMVGHTIPTNGLVYYDGAKWDRGTGFTVADDWTAKMGDGMSGFKEEKFTPAEYTEIAGGAKYVGGTYYSTYADYQLFKVLYSITTQPADKRTININEIKASIPDGDKFNVPFNYEDDGFGGVEYKNLGNVANIASENELANAMDFANERAAFLAMFRAGGSTADYVIWSGVKDPTAEGSFVCKIDGHNRFFRLNHYIYYIQNDLAETKCITSTGEKQFAPDDLQWVLTQSVRGDIMYADITQENLTTELVTYRRDWFNKGDTPFITYRDYCEWICIYAHDDTYQADRGDMAKEMQDQMGGATGDTGDTGTNKEQLKTTDGWLTLEAFAVWKRMEKYENNVEYIAKSGDYTPKQSAITAPILKRQISTTVFPHIHDSGNKTVDPDTGKVTNDKYTLPKVFNSQTDANLVAYYDWGYTNPYGEYYDKFKDTKIDLNHQRHAKDRYEYNECGNEYTILRWSKELNYSTGGSIYDYASDYIDDAKFSKKCDATCGGLTNGSKCNNTSHAKYQVRQWNNRYIFHYNCGITINLRLDEVVRFNDSIYLPKAVDTAYGDNNIFAYNQLYIPYDTFKRACQQIKASYTQSGKEKGYANYMKYWARNGSFSDICDLTAYPYPTTIGAHGYRLINNTYLATDFWSVYDGTKDPATGDKWADKKAVVW